MSPNNVPTFAEALISGGTPTVDNVTVLSSAEYTTLGTAGNFAKLVRILPPGLLGRRGNIVTEKAGIYPRNAVAAFVRNLVHGPVSFGRPGTTSVVSFKFLFCIIWFCYLRSP